MQPNAFPHIVDLLTADQPPRVWSLLISVFGDLAQQDGAQVSGALLRLITRKIGIKPEAMRVAIHRLRKDGWIDSQRNGRTSSYFLTERGRAQSAAASPRIYATQEAADTAWLLVQNPAEPARDDDLCATWVSPHVGLTGRQPPETLSRNADTLATRLDAQTAVPEWVTHRVCGAELVAQSQCFAETLGRVQHLLNQQPALSTDETAILRVLLVHSWRRIVLKAPALPDFVFPDAWRGPYCRTTVAQLLANHPKPALEELEAAAGRG